MSRVGKQIIPVPAGVTITVSPNLATIKGPKGELSVSVPKGILVAITEDGCSVSRKNDVRQLKAFHGLVRNLISNAVVGVTDGYKKTLKMVGTGYRVQAKGSNLSLAVGFSHPVEVSAMPGITFQVEGNDTIHISGVDKQQVGQVAANVRAIRPPEPYKGKGLRYSDEVVKTKPGKTASS